MEFSGTGLWDDAPVAMIDFVEPTAQASTSSAGCEDADFPAGATGLADKIAVIQRGTCDFGLKALNAKRRLTRARGSSMKARSAIRISMVRSAVPSVATRNDPGHRVDVPGRPIPSTIPLPPLTSPPRWDRNAHDAQCHRRIQERPQRPRRHLRRAPRLGPRRAQVSTTMAAARQPSSSSPRKWRNST